jgi:uncharacterized membrane protein YdjX (TVP38/TMEM64 family)
MGAFNMDTTNTEELQQIASSARDKSFVQQHWQKLVALVLWALLLGAYFWYTTANNLGPLQAGRQLVDIMQNSAYGPLIYIGLYALRPLIFFSATILTLAGGFVFGPVWGMFFTVIASNTSSMVAYTIGRYFGQDALDADESAGLIQRYATRMRNNSFETVLIMRFIFLPYDLVSYLAGFLRIDWKAFLLATALGSIPGTISFVLVGASSGLTEEGLEFNPLVLIPAVIIFVISLALSRFFKRREQVRNEEQTLA